MGLIECGRPELGARLRCQWRTAERRRGCYCSREWRRRRERGAGETEWRVGARGAVPTGVSRSAAARPRRRRTVATWPAPGGARRAPCAEERGGETGPRCLAGPKGRRVGQAAPASFLFFFEIIFPKSLNETFEAFRNLFRGWSKKKNCSP